jgi:outer membrane protein insertion porin family
MRDNMTKPVLISLVLIFFIVLTGCKSNEEIRLKKLQDEGLLESGNFIRSIDFVNKKTFKKKTLKKKLDFKAGDKYDTVLIETGKNDLSEYYRKKGFAEVKITVDNSELAKGKVIYVVDEGPRFVIKSVKFTGNKILKTSDLRSIIKTKTRELVFWPSFYTEEKIAADVKKLQNAYYQRGFLNYDIKALGRSDITFLIDEGPQYRVGKIDVTDNEKFDKETLLSNFELKTGDIYYPLKAQAQAKKMLRLYRENGYVEAIVKQKHIFTETGSNIIDIEFNITEGKQFRIGQIEISGNEQTQDKVVRRVLDEYDFSPGELYNADIAPPEGGGNLEKRVKRYALAEEVSITPSDTEPNQSEKLDAQVNVKEGLTGMWNPGVAYGSDDGFYGQLSWSQGNFDITDWPESVGEFITMQSFKGAGQRLNVDLRPGTQVSTYSISFTEPYLNNKPTSLNVTGSSWERWFESHDEKRTKASVSFQKRYKSLWRSNLGFRVENVEVGNLEFDAPQEIRDYKGYNLLLGTKIGLGRDETDDMYLPSKGYVFNVDYEQVTGDDDFGILEGTGILYKTLNEDFRQRKTILATKILAATTFSDAPFYEKFYAGGIGTYGIRGFRYRGISTRGLQTNVPNPVYKDPIGSEWIFLANTELAVPLAGENVSLLFFADSGTIETGPYRVSVGTGLQIMVPQFFGPIPLRFTLAEPLRKDDDDERQAFSFFMGGMFPY